MSTAKTIVMGTMIGIIISSLTLGMALAGLLLLTGKVAIIGTVVLWALVSGAILGASSVTLSYLTSGSERYVLVLLIGLIVAALAVLAGRYGNGSLIPASIYALAIVNSLLASRATKALKVGSKATTGPYLQR